MDKRHKSGAEKRKQKEQKHERDRKLLSKIPKLTKIFRKETKETENENNSDSSAPNYDTSTEKDNTFSDTELCESVLETLSIAFDFKRSCFFTCK